MSGTEAGKKSALCNTCTLKLVSIAYRRAPWFRLIREPLKAGMHLLSLIHRVHPSSDMARTPRCAGCIRFYKLALKEKSGFFRKMNDLCNPLFDALLERIVTAEEIQAAKAYARAASQGEIPPDDADKWMQGMYTGFVRRLNRE